VKIVLFLCLVFVSIIYAQENRIVANSESNYFQVDSIQIIGNEKTENFIILRELSFTIGDTVNNKMLHFNRERIFSLGIFTKVNITIEKYKEKNIVSILIEESWYIFPVPFVNVREKSLEQTSYGVSLKFKNIRGRNETIRATISLGYDPFFSLEYENPLIISAFDLNMFFSFAYGKSVNKSEILESIYGETFDFNSMSLNTMWGKRFGEKTNLFLIFSYSKIKVPSNKLNSFMSSGSSIDEKISTGISYLYDSRNLKQYASNGEVFELSYSYNGLLNSNNFNAINLDMRKYREIYNSFIVKGRFTARHTFGKFVPIYDYSMLGYDYYVRGNRYELREGNNRILANLELSYPILSEWNFAIELPILPNSLTRARISIIAGLFADAGTIFNNTDRIRINNFNTGYGFGLTFLLLPYSSFRIEYALNEFGKGEVLFATGISF